MEAYNAAFLHSTHRSHARPPSSLKAPAGLPLLPPLFDQMELDLPHHRSAKT